MATESRSGHPCAAMGSGGAITRPRPSNADFQNRAFRKFAGLLGQLPQFIAAIFVNQRVSFDAVEGFDESAINVPWGIRCEGEQIFVCEGRRLRDTVNAKTKCPKCTFD